MSKRRTVNLSEDNHDMIERAAFWEGFKNPSAFIVSVMRRHIVQREEDRGSQYGKPMWPHKKPQDEDEDAES